MRAVNFGAEPAMAIERRMRPVEYRPEFSEDIAAVSTTRFITSPAAGTPIFDRTVTNGLWSAEYTEPGSSRASSTTEPT